MSERERDTATGFRKHRVHLCNECSVYRYPRPGMILCLGIMCRPRDLHFLRTAHPDEEFSNFLSVRRRR